MVVYIFASSLLILRSFRQVLHGTAGGMSPQVQARSQQLPGSTPVSTSSSHSSLILAEVPHPRKKKNNSLLLVLANALVCLMSYMLFYYFCKYRI